MGRSCITFTSAEELPLAVVGDIIRASDVGRYVEAARAARGGS